MRNAVSLEGDADTLAAIAGALGEALHGLPEGLVKTIRKRYLQDAEDITGALNALYERGNSDEVPESRIDLVSGSGSGVASRSKDGMLSRTDARRCVSSGGSPS